MMFFKEYDFMSVQMERAIVRKLGYKHQKYKQPFSGLYKSITMVRKISVLAVLCPRDR